MPSTADRNRVEELRDLLRRANRAYHVDAESIISDREYDQLLAELIDLESRFPELHDEASPSQRVGGEPIEGFETVDHLVPMLSIDNTYSEGDLEAWYDRVVRGIGETEQAVEFYCDPKIDGVAISLWYEDGQLKRAVTRGDGTRGDDVTAQVRTVRAIPLQLGEGEGSHGILEVRGELFIPNSEFDRINTEREAAGEPLFANARNSTAGTLKSLDPRVVAARRLSFFAHGRGVVESPEPPTTAASFFAQLRNLGIPTSPLAVLCRTIAEVVAAVHSFQAKRPKLDYGVDGIVIRVNSFEQQAMLGATSKAPRWCIAYKYPAEQGTTTLVQVEWQVGKNGTLTPRATMEPIFLAGTTVSHATLHNIDEIDRKDIRIGDRVIIEKAGEIIPQVIRPLIEDRTGEEQRIVPPAKCPACGAAVDHERRPKLYCVNPECPAQFSERLKWFVGRGQMDIDGLGEKLIDQLIESGLVSHFADLFTLTIDQFADLDRMGRRSAENVVAALSEAKGRGLARVLAGLGIPQIGVSASRELARTYPDAEALLATSVEELVELPDFGEITAGILHGYLQSPGGQEAFRRLRDVGVDLASREFGETPTEATPVSGKTIVITGTLEHFGRKELGDMLRTLGAAITGSVTSKTDILISGAKAGSKLTKAQELGTEVWDEDRLRSVLATMQEG